MKNLSFNTHDADKICEAIEEKLRGELKASDPVPYTIESETSERTSIGTVLRDIKSVLSGGNANELFTVRFTFSQPRPVTMLARVTRQGVGAHVAMLEYGTLLAKSVGGEVMLEAPKFLGKSKFTGDTVASAALNANSDLIKRANNLARTESDIGGLKFKIERCMKVVPYEAGSALVLHTLPRLTSMGFNAALDADEFCAVADMVEKAL